MTALANATNSISELLTLVQERKPWRSHAGMIAVFLIVAASVASSLSYTARADREMDRQFQNKLALYRAQAQRISLAEQSRNQALELAQQAGVDATLTDSLPRSRALAEVSNATPAGVRLTAILLDSDLQPGQPDAMPRPARHLDIQGVATTDAAMTRFVKDLSQSPWLHGVNVLPSTGQAHRFEVSATFGDPDAVK